MPLFFEQERFKCHTLPSSSLTLLRSFFDNYLVCLRKASIPEKQRRWYVKRVEAFIKAHNGLKIKVLSGDDIVRLAGASGLTSTGKWMTGMQGWHSC
jgi:hypothetical protein